MKLLSRISIARKITLVIVTAVVGMLVMLLVVTNNISSNAERLDALKNRHYPLLQETQANLIKLDQIANEISTAAMIGEADMLAKADDLKTQIESSLTRSKDLGADAVMLNALQKSLDAYFAPARGMAAAMIDGSFDMDKMAQQGEQVSAAQAKLREQMTQFEQDVAATVDRVVAEAGATSDATVWLGVMIGVITSVLVILIGLTVSRSVVSAVNGVADSLKEISQGEGDLTVRLSYDGFDELGRMVKYFNDFVDKLQHTISDIRSSMQALHRTAESLSMASAKTNTQITSQGDAIEKTTAALSEMFISVSHIAEHAASASCSAEEANSEATHGSAVVQTTVSSISELAQEIIATSALISQLESHTNNVGSILATIRGIAEQTNLLALNAAIEAARAGEQGRGFAVVADEVRSLASRTQDSTQEIQQVLEELQSSSKRAVDAMARGTSMASDSVEQSNSAGASLDAITDKVGGIVMLNNQIAAATEEQNQTSELIQQYVAEIQQMAQDAITSTSALDEISRTLNDASEQVATVVNQFKV